MQMSNLPATVLLDTNILVRAAVNTDPLRSIAIAAIEKLELSGSVIHVCPQNMQEFRQVATQAISRKWPRLDVGRCRKCCHRIRAAIRNDSRNVSNIPGMALHCGR
jgi:predicted nucleic acid-binding protein